MASTSLPIGYRYATPIELLTAGRSPTSRQVVTPAGELISRRQAEKIDAQLRGFATKEEQRAASGTSGISSEEQAYRASWRKQAEWQDLKKSIPDLVKSLGKQQGGMEYERQRLDIFLKFGLISAADYDRYKGV